MLRPRPLTAVAFLSVLTASAGRVPDAAAGVCTPPPSALLAWWPGDGNGEDIVGGNDVTLVGGTSFASGMVGQAFSFDGIDDSATTGTASIDTVDPLTIDAWIRTNEIGGSPDPYQVIVGEIGSANNEGEFQFRLDPANQLQFVRRPTGGFGVTVLTTDAAVVPGVWTHVAAVYAGGNDLKIYIDGVPASGTIQQDQYGSSMPTVTRIAMAEPVQSPFDGLIDEVEIFGRALQDSELAAIYQAGSAGKCRTVVICHMAGTPAEKTKEIPVQALAGHLGHGDTRGPCQ